MALILSLEKLSKRVRQILSALSPCYALASAPSAGNTVAHNTATVIGFNTIESDARSAITGTGTSWKFTVPENYGGLYLIAAGIFMVGAPPAGDAYLNVYKNNVNTRLLGLNSVAGSRAVGGACLVSAAAGDYFTVKLHQFSGGDVSLSGTAADNHVGIFRLPFVL